MSSKKIRMTHGNPSAQHAVSTKAGIVRFSNGGIANPTKEQREALDEIGFPYEELTEPFEGDYGDRWGARQANQPLVQIPALDTNPKRVEDYTEAEKARHGLPNTAAGSVTPDGEAVEAEPTIAPESLGQAMATEPTGPRYQQADKPKAAAKKPSRKPTTKR